MSTMTTETSPEQEAATNVEVSIGDKPAAAETNPAEALRWFEIVDVPEVGFKAFVRLVNDYQHKDIREKAMAAKARRLRALKNPDTDAWEVLNHEIETIAESEGAEANLVHELLLDRLDRDRYHAIQEVNELPEYEHVSQDQQRFREMQAMTSDERPEDEWRELIEHLAGYAKAIEAATDEIQKPRREALAALGLDGLLEKVRERRVDAEGRRAFNDTYSFWQTYVGTLEIPEDFDPENITRESIPRKRVFATEQDLRDVDPLVGARIGEAFERLEGAISTLSAGNS